MVTYQTLSTMWFGKPVLCHKWYSNELLRSSTVHRNHDLTLTTLSEIHCIIF